jgi:hypothetical protein
MITRIGCTCSKVDFSQIDLTIEPVASRIKPMTKNEMPHQALVSLLPLCLLTACGYCHWCPDETILLLGALPYLSFYLKNFGKNSKPPFD